jgi:GH24 family phage-related lysozyme (muramidase)
MESTELGATVGSEIVDVALGSGALFIHGMEAESATTLVSVSTTAWAIVANSWEIVDGATRPVVIGSERTELELPTGCVA